MKYKKIIQSIQSAFPGEHHVIETETTIQKMPRKNLQVAYYLSLSLNILVLNKSRYNYGYSSGTEIHIGGLTLDNYNNVLPVEIFLHYHKKHMVLEKEAMECFKIGKCVHLSGNPYYCPDDDYIQFFKPQFWELGEDEMPSDLLNILIHSAKVEDLFLEDESYDGQSCCKKYNKEKLFNLKSGL